MQTGIDPRHRPHHLSLLPSGPDEVRDRLLRGVRSKWSKLSKYKTLGREFSPALSGFRVKGTASSPPSTTRD